MTPSNTAAESKTQAGKEERKSGEKLHRFDNLRRIKLDVSLILVIL
jgi:hypothetical protein